MSDHDMPILAAVEYQCPIDGMRATMDRFYGGPAYAHYWHYAIRCMNPNCPNHEVGMRDWKDSPADAIRAWNRRTS